MLAKLVRFKCKLCGSKTKREEFKMAVVAMKQLLEAGVHFGHQTRRWDQNGRIHIPSQKWNSHYRFTKTSKKIR